jgi:Ca2+-binding EF-hand superfamily protein
MTTSSAVLQSAQKNALSMLSIYDPSQQGSINAADITTAFSTNPTLSGGQTAAEVMALFDLNSDGIIDPDELVSGSELQTLSDMVFQKLDPTNTGFITTTNLATADGSGLPFALSTIAKWDANGDGSITPAEAIKGIYSEVVSTIGQFDTSGKGYFDQADVQAVIDANPTQYGSYSAASVLSQWDVNGDGEVTPSDVLACMVASAKNAAAIPSTASGAYASAKTTADATMELFDATGKGSITRDDIAGTYNADASLGMPSDAPSTLSAWDVNGDGKVTELELMEDSIAAKMANSLLSQLDPEGTGAIDVSSLASSSISAPYLSDPATTIASWDKNGDGSISQSELISGIEAQASSFLSQYDMTGKGYFSQSDVQAVLDMNPSLSGITASGMMKEWDANGDGKVDMADVLSGLSMGQNPSAITWSSDTAPSADQVLAAMGLNTSSTATQSA